MRDNWLTKFKLTWEKADVVVGLLILVPTLVYTIADIENGTRFPLRLLASFVFLALCVGIIRHVKVAFQIFFCLNAFAMVVIVFLLVEQPSNFVGRYGITSLETLLMTLYSGLRKWEIAPPMTANVKANPEG